MGRGSDLLAGLRGGVEPQGSSLFDSLKAAKGPRREGLSKLAKKYAVRSGGRPSDAVREYLRSRPEEADRRGQLLAAARQVMVTLPRSVYDVPVHRRMPRKRVGGQELLAIEVFAGGGLFSLANAIEGNAEVDSCEISGPATKTRAHNQGALNLRHTPRTSDARTWRPPLNVPDGVDLLFGGPPCKPFSKGAYLGRGQRQRGWLAPDNFFPVALDWICDLQPRIVCFENAPDLAKGKYRAYLDQWMEQVSALGYDSAAHLLKAADFGNPTMRSRVFVYAWPKGAPWGRGLRKKPEGNYAEPGAAQVRSGKKLPWVPMVDRLTSGCCGGWGLVDCVFLGGYAIKCRSCSSGQNFYPAPNTSGDVGKRGYRGVSVSGKPWHRWIKETVGSRQPRFDKFTPADAAGAFVDLKTQARDLTLPARRISEYLMRTVVPNFTNKAEGLMILPNVRPEQYADTKAWSKEMLEELRSMSARDAAKLQDLPQWYEFCGTRTQVFSQIGMGVPINLGRGVIRHARKAMGLKLRAPWYETEKPTIRRQIPYQTRQQIKNSTSKPQLIDGLGDGYPAGLWPTDALDMCYAVPPTLDFGPMLQHDVLDDWERMLHQKMIGAQEERRIGRSKAQRGARPLPVARQKERRIAQGRRVGDVFTDDGIDLEALWNSGWRGAPGDYPDFMPGVTDPVTGELYYGTDPASEWRYILQFSFPAEWTTHWGMYFRDKHSRAFKAQDQLLPWGRKWEDTFPLGNKLPKQVEMIHPQDRVYTQADLRRAKKK